MLDTKEARGLVRCLRDRNIQALSRKEGLEPVHALAEGDGRRTRGVGTRECPAGPEMRDQKVTGDVRLKGWVEGPPRMVAA